MMSMTSPFRSTNALMEAFPVLENRPSTTPSTRQVSGSVNVMVRKVETWSRVLLWSFVLMNR